MPRFAEKLLYSYARRFPIRKGKLRVVNGLWRSMVKNGSTAREAELIHGGYRIECELNQWMQRQFYFFGTYFLEEENLKCWQEHAREAEVVFDVGANLGIYSLAALAANPHAKVFAFEPTATLATRLRGTAIRNRLEDRLSVEEVAVARESGEALLNVWGAEEERNEGLNFVTQVPVAQRTVAVSTTSLNDFCASESIARIDLLKLDIQGNEAEALRGARRLLEEGRIACVFTELNWAAAATDHCPATETVELLETQGFRFAAPECGSKPRRAGPWIRQLRDVVAMRS